MMIERLKDCCSSNEKNETMTKLCLEVCELLRACESCDAMFSTAVLSRIN